MLSTPINIYMCVCHLQILQDSICIYKIKTCLRSGILCTKSVMAKEPQCEKNILKTKENEEGKEQLMQVKHRKEEKKTDHERTMKELYTAIERKPVVTRKRLKKQRTGRTHAGIHSTIASNAAKNTRAYKSRQ